MNVSVGRRLLERGRGYVESTGRQLGLFPLPERTPILARVLWAAFVCEAKTRGWKGEVMREVPVAASRVVEDFLSVSWHLADSVTYEIGNFTSKVRDVRGGPTCGAIRSSPFLNLLASWIS